MIERTPEREQASRAAALRYICGNIQLARESACRRLAGKPTDLAPEISFSHIEQLLLDALVLLIDTEDCLDADMWVLERDPVTAHKVFQDMVNGA